jgi:hypothetical protein
MTTPADDEPQPRGIALEQATPEQVEELVAASDDDRSGDRRRSSDPGGTG